jgi:hypothetical protein
MQRTTRAPGTAHAISARAAMLCSSTQNQDLKNTYVLTMRICATAFSLSLLHSHIHHSTASLPPSLLQSLPSTLPPFLLHSLLSSYPTFLSPLLLLCLQRIAGSSMSVGCINPTSAYTNPHSADAAASTPGQGLTRHYPVLERCVMLSLLSCYTKTTIISIINISVLFRLCPASPPFIDFHHTLIHTSADPDSYKQL